MKTTTFEFMNDLNSVVFGDYVNTSFRYNSLLLLKKYFNVTMGSFIVYEKNIANHYAFKNHHMDNIVMGINYNALNEYYNTYYKLSPLEQAPLSETLLRMSDVISYEDYENTKFYKDYASHYDFYYQIRIGLTCKENLIGSIVLIRTKEQGDFLDSELDQFKKMQALISAELIKCLMFEKVTLENLALKKQAEVFPIAQIILDNEFNVIYYNEDAEKITKDLSGDDPYHFKYFFMNEVIAKKLLDSNKKECEIQSKNYILRIQKEMGKYDISLTTEQFYYVVYISEILNKKPRKRNKLKAKLTKRENEVVQLIKKGLTNDEIAEALFISPFTVKTHTQSIYEKLGVNSKTQLLHELFKE